MSAKLNASTGRRPRLLVLLLGALLLALLLTMLEFMLLQSRRSIEREAAQRARTLAVGAAAGLDGLFSRSRLWLDELERVIDPEELRSEAAPSEDRLAELGDWIDDLRRRNPELANIGYLDAQGRSYRQRARQGSRLSLADTDYWRQLQALGPAGAGKLVLTRVHPLRTTGKPGLALARGLYGRDRQLVGAIVAGLHVQSLEQLLSSLNPGHGAAVLVLDREDLLVARDPPVAGAGERRMSAPRLPGPDAGSYFSVSNFDGQRRLGAGVALREVPLHIAVGLAEDDYLAGWQRHRRDLHLAMLALALAALLPLWLQRRTRRISQALRRSEDLLGATLALLPTASLHAGAPELRVMHSNPAARQLLALADTPGIRLPELFADADQAAALLAQLGPVDGLDERDGVAGPLDVQLRRGGQTFWATVQLRRLQDSEDLLMTLIDIDARHQREAELVEQSSTDALTGVANRRAFELAAASALAQCRQQGQGLSLLLIDLDHFKAVNDRLGHAAGDQVLRAVADTLQLQLRSPDLLARVGGEEFVALLPNTGLAAARQVAQRVLGALRARPVQLQDGSELTVSASIGVSSCLIDESDIDWAMARADTAMYRAKDNGRDRCEVQE